MLAFATACTPTASGSVSAACSAARPFGTSQQHTLREQHALGEGAEIVVGVADALRAVRGQQRGSEQTRVPGLSLPVVPGP